MKIFALTLAALASAQKKKGNKNKNNNYAPTTDAPTTDAPTTEYPGTDAPGPYGGGAGGAYGDPHFMVKSPSQSALCFDFNPAEGTDMNLLVDPESALAISATAKGRANGKVFMDSIHFASPGGAHLEFDVDGVHVAGLGDGSAASAAHPLTGAQSYGDIHFIEKWSVDGLHEHTKVQIEDGPVFVIKGNLKKESLSFAVEDTEGISSRSRGIIGQFIRDDSYFITDNGDDTATVVSGGMSVEATRENFHHTSNCWVINDEDMLFMMANL